MQIAFAIIASLIITYIWIWLLNTIFSERKMKRVISFKILGSGIFLVGILYIYSSLSSWFPPLNPFLLSQFYSTHSQQIFFFVLYCSIGIILLTLIFHNRYNKILQSIIVWIVCFLLIGYGSFALGISAIVLFYILSAYAEEYLKYNTGNNLLMEEKRKEQTDIILFCILIALGFSLIENLLYIGTSIFQHSGSNLISLSIGRGVISSLIHVVSTGLIAFISLRFPKMGTTTVPIIIGLLLWFGLHTTYNLGLNFQLSYITVSVIIVSIFLLSYLFFRSNSLYRKS